MDPRSTLNLIDSLRPTQSKLSTLPNAATLEREARRLVSEYWSDNVWLTGHVPAASLDAVIDRLERLA
jgi:hypothetical protein